VRYVATAVEVGNQVYTVNAVSDLLRDIKDPRETNTGAILTDAGIGAAGGAAVGGILTVEFPSAVSSAGPPPVPLLAIQRPSG
jgi:hypothetical protein